MIFVDFTKVFDSVRIVLIEKNGKLLKLERLIEMAISNISAKVMIRNRVCEAFDVLPSVRHDDTLSDTLFNIALQEAFKYVFVCFL